MSCSQILHLAFVIENFHQSFSFLIPTEDCGCVFVLQIAAAAVNLATDHM